MSNQKSAWKSIGTYPASSNMPPHATVGASRIYYENTETGAYCYRLAGFKNLMFRDHGMGNPCDVDGNDIKAPAIPERDFN